MEKLQIDLKALIIRTTYMSNLLKFFTLLFKNVFYDNNDESSYFFKKWTFYLYFKIVL